MIVPENDRFPPDTTPLPEAAFNRVRSFHEGHRDRDKTRRDLIRFAIVKGISVDEVLSMVVDALDDWTVDAPLRSGDRVHPSDKPDAVSLIVDVQADGFVCRITPTGYMDGIYLDPARWVKVDPATTREGMRNAVRDLGGEPGDDTDARTVHHATGNAVWLLQQLKDGHENRAAVARGIDAAAGSCGLTRQELLLLAEQLQRRWQQAEAGGPWRFGDTAMNAFGYEYFVDGVAGDWVVATPTLTGGPRLAWPVDSPSKRRLPRAHEGAAQIASQESSAALA